MIYPFECEPCGITFTADCEAFTPPPAPKCASCGELMTRIYGCYIDTSGCRDHDHIPESKRVVRSGSITSGRNVNAVREERRFQKHIDQRRQLYKERGQNPEFQHTHSVPADLYHGKIRETGDANYWDNPKNLARHSSTKVS